MADPPRSAAQRKQDTLARLDRDIDVWVATAGQNGDPYLVPLAFVWDGARITLSTPERSPTGRNMETSGRVRLGFGPTRDVVVMDGNVQTFTRENVPTEIADAFAEKNWDARLDTPRYGFYLVTPERIQAWREENELAGRVLMRDGRWLV